MIFFIWSFFVGYILSFDLVKPRTIRLSAHAGTHIEYRCSRSRTEDVTITDVIIKTPDAKWDVNDVIPGSDGMGILVIFEKAVSWDLNLRELRSEARRGQLRFKPEIGENWSWTRRVPFVAHGTRRAFVASDGTVSIVKIVSLSLSLLVSKD